jgi:probable phosphoglycerate mutase
MTPISPEDGAAPALAAVLWLIRHGETEWNAQSRIQGHIDIALSARGRRQAQALARCLRATPLAAVYASDLSRARETALPVAVAGGLELRIDPRLRERGFGLFEGSTYAEAQANWPHEYAIWQRREPGHALPGGESYLQARARVLQCLEEIVRRHGVAPPGGAHEAAPAVAIVTHGGVLDIVYRHAMAIPWETPRSHLLPNASINRVAVRRAAAARPPPLAYEILGWAEAGHLDGTRDELA